ncbi:hypothetical protein PLICRDRAFT_177571 [Plicaturopsis crispa FD-325 SS-3]|nr:hypothetical protein PLICRDRAFT_177571 [Plicaturopsis crispa FD-325 SS-3]
MDFSDGTDRYPVAGPPSPGEHTSTNPSVGSITKDAQSLSVPKSTPHSNILANDIAALTAQTLHADGTPKRPMNAFMIFARKRRPQVAEGNESLRTGDISKILSKEWGTMPATDKQFYFDQAKILKDNFDARYPDYVYRRRPNNFRKKRATNDGITMDNSDTGDDMPGMDPSPLRGEHPEDALASHSMWPPPFPRRNSNVLPAAAGSPYGLYAPSPGVSRPRSKSNVLYHGPSMGASPARSSYISVVHPPSQDLDLTPTPQNYYSEQSAAYPWNWEHDRVDRSHLGPREWQERNPPRPQASTSGNNADASQSYPIGQRPRDYTSGVPDWDLTVSHSAPGPASRFLGYDLPIMNTPFYPSESSLSSDYSSSAASSTSHSSRSQYDLYDHFAPSPSSDTSLYSSSPETKRDNAMAFQQSFLPHSGSEVYISPQSSPTLLRHSPDSEIYEYDFERR